MPSIQEPPIQDTARWSGYCLAVLAKQYALTYLGKMLGSLKPWIEGAGLEVSPNVEAAMFRELQLVFVWMAGTLVSDLPDSAAMQRALHSPFSQTSADDALLHQAHAKTAGYTSEADFFPLPGPLMHSRIRLYSALLMRGDDAEDVYGAMLRRIVPMEYLHATLQLVLLTSLHQFCQAFRREVNVMLSENGLA